MRSGGCQRPIDPEDRPAQDPGWLGSMAAWAGFCGAIPIGFGLVVVLFLCFNAWPAQSWVEGLTWLPIVGLAMMPVAIASASVGRRDRPRLLGVAATGLCVGVVSTGLCIFAWLILYPAAALGAVLGVVAVGPCWMRRDAAGRALALLGLVPVAILFLFAVAVPAARERLASDSTPAEIPGLRVISGLLFLVETVVLAWLARRIHRRDRAKPRPGPACP